MDNWQNVLYNGLVADKGRTPPVASGSITKPMREKQVPEHMVPTLEVMSDNNRMTGLNTRSKSRFSIHRSMAFNSHD